MEILIIGTGNVGTAMAADLTKKGNDVTMLKTTKKVDNEHYEKIKKENIIIFKDINKEEENVKIKNITEDYEVAFSNSPKIIIVCIQTNYHEDVIKKIVKYLNKDQILILNPGYLSTAYVLKYCDKKNIPVIVEMESSTIDCRIYESGKVGVIFKNVRNPIGVYPKEKSKDTLAVLENLDYNYTLTNSVIEAALHNPNLIVHTIGAIMSIPRIEYSKGEYWMYREVFTPSIWNLVEGLDNEKMKVLEKLGLDKIPYVEACKLRNSEDLSINAKEVFFDYAKNHSPKGPNISNSRYITEDVPQGLVLLESLGQVLNIKTPICSSLIDVAGACLKCDFRKNGRTIKKLGRKNLNNIIKE